MSSVVYGLVVSSAEMVSVYPYCRGTVGLADRFVDPALGFAMGWNAWFHWGMVIPSQIAAAMSLINDWNYNSQLLWALPAIFIVLTTGSVFGARIYGELESGFAMIKLFAVVVLVGVAIVIDSHDVAHNRSPFRFWDPPFAQYRYIAGAKGRFLGFYAVLIQAAISFFGTEIPFIIAGELKDAPRAIYPVAKRLWVRVSIIYLITVFVAGTLVPRELLNALKLINPDGPNSPDLSPFLIVLKRAGSSYNWIRYLCIACFITSAASVASIEVFISARYLYFLAKAGHAPAFFGAAWIGTLFTYIRFWWGTRHPENQQKYRKEIKRIKENRAWGQPFWAIYSFTICSAILIFNGLIIFSQKNNVLCISPPFVDTAPKDPKALSRKFYHLAYKKQAVHLCQGPNDGIISFSPGCSAQLFSATTSPKPTKKNSKKDLESEGALLLVGGGPDEDARRSDIGKLIDWSNTLPCPHPSLACPMFASPEAHAAGIAYDFECVDPSSDLGNCGGCSFLDNNFKCPAPISARSLGSNSGRSLINHGVKRSMCVQGGCQIGRLTNVGFFVYTEIPDRPFNLLPSGVPTWIQDRLVLR
ncbi:hypothetical protein M407DRAFT_23211 [Tulasnella calospora MUT 4182]|uniref:Amino acid permease/ SLC12A domain-containing protein n=1 Tax=Tulasnella calospora MUT 4182 TaxID=1051891 RepID=A0A0C3QJX9_9AGAM|nr:hypothetical protein M407DRAFT_23211 [Tulasnella calospora MUT 4182]